MTLAEIDIAIRVTCPIIGVNSSGLIWFDESATEVQKKEAKELMDKYLPTLDERDK